MSKEALFNILNNHFNFAELSVLDLFAGTGNISFEFASRGSEPIVSVDADFGCISFIKKTTDEFEFNITAIKSDVFKFLEKTKGNFDIIFADPPYGMTQENFEKVVQSVFERELLSEDGMMIVEHSKHTKLEHLNQFSFQKNYGGSTFSFFEWESESDNDEIEEDDSEE
jgi:16S rRNA (guanine(966)-N(2))-methyltransferase RsmD